jgi:hypothetical protein
MPIQITDNKKTIPNTPTHLKWVCGQNELLHYIKLLRESSEPLFFCNLITKIEVHEIKTFFPTIRSYYRLNSGRREGEEGWAELMFYKEPLQRCKYIHIMCIKWRAEPRHSEARNGGCRLRVLLRPNTRRRTGINCRHLRRKLLGKIVTL